MSDLIRKAAHLALQRRARRNANRSLIQRTADKLKQQFPKPPRKGLRRWL